MYTSSHLLGDDKERERGEEGGGRASVAMVLCSCFPGNGAAAVAR